MHTTDILSTGVVKQFPGTGTVFAIAIDTLPVLEDLFGEDTGQEIIRAVAGRIEAVLPPGATMCGASRGRIIVSTGQSDRGEIARTASRIQAAGSGHPVDTSEGPLGVTLSIGAVPARSGEPGSVSAMAFDALARAQADGPGAFSFANDTVALSARRDTIKAASETLSSALGRSALSLAYQPVVRALGGQTIGFHECLLRLTAPDGTLRPAGSFIPAAQQLGLTQELDRRALLMVADSLARHPLARLSVNVAPATMADQAWMDLFTRRIAAVPERAERLIVEITEDGAMLDPERTMRFLDTVRNSGAAVAVDDFGAGSTSLRYIRDFRFDMMKIDGSFIEGILDKPDNQFLVRSMASVARHFEMMSVAEYVQGPEEARLLMELGIEYFQGFHYGAPSLVLDPAPVPEREVMVAV